MKLALFFLMSFMQILLHPLFAPLKDKKVPSQKLLCQEVGFTFIDICPLLIPTAGGGRRGAAPAWM